MTVVRLQHQQQLLDVSGVQTNKASSDVDMSYDKNGGDQSNAW